MVRKPAAEAPIEERPEEDEEGKYDSDTAATDALRGALGLSLQAAQRLTRKLEGRDGLDDATGLSVLLEGALQVTREVERRRVVTSRRLRHTLAAVAQLRAVMTEQRKALRQFSAMAGPRAGGAAGGMLRSESAAEEVSSVAASAGSAPGAAEAIWGVTSASKQDAATDVAADASETTADAKMASAAASTAETAAAELEEARMGAQLLRERVAILERAAMAEQDRREVSEAIANATRLQEEHLRHQLSGADAACEARLAHAARQNEAMGAVIDKLEAIVSLQQDCLNRRRPRGRSGRSGGGGYQGGERDSRERGSSRSPPPLPPRQDWVPSYEVTETATIERQPADYVRPEAERLSVDELENKNALGRGNSGHRRSSKGAEEQGAADGEGAQLQQRRGQIHVPAAAAEGPGPGRPPLAPIYLGLRHKGSDAAEAECSDEEEEEGDEEEEEGEGEDALRDEVRNMRQADLIDVSLQLTTKWPPPGFNSTGAAAEWRGGSGWRSGGGGRAAGGRTVLGEEAHEGSSA